MDPDDDGQLFGGGLGTGVDVEEQAVFVAHVFPERALLSLHTCAMIIEQLTRALVTFGYVLVS